MGPPTERRTLKLDCVPDTERPGEIWYDGRLKTEPLEEPVDETDEERELVSEGEDLEEDYWSFSSEDDEGVALVDCYHVSLVDIMKTAHERIVRPAIAAEEWAC